ncbi:hypothetical protein CALVIDRAFT_472070, partial [Calocera viscosa TUFC12733]
VGRPCCAIHNCPLPLTSNRARFCVAHAERKPLCAVEGCEAPRCAGRLTCDILQHQALEDRYKAPGKSFSLLTHRRQRAYERVGEGAEGAEKAEGEGDVEM